MRNAAILRMPDPTPDIKPKGKPRRERGEGRIYKMSGSNKWWIQYYVNGRQIRESSRSKVKQVAVELLNQRLVEKRNGETRDGQKRSDKRRDGEKRKAESREPRAHSPKRKKR